MAQTVTDLDTAIAGLSTALQAVQTALANFKPPTGTVDLTPEVTGINNASATLAQIATQIAALSTPPAV